MTYSYNLPHQAKNNVLFAFIEIIRSNVDNVAANRLCRPNGECQVLMTLVDAQRSTRLTRLVNRLLMDRISLREVYQLATIMYKCLSLHTCTYYITPLYIINVKNCSLTKC